MQEHQPPHRAAATAPPDRGHEENRNPGQADKSNKIGLALASFSTVAVAYSGGVDSTFAAWFAAKKLQKRVTAVFVDTPFTSARERDDAYRTAEALSFEMVTLAFDPLESDIIRQNPVDRCYHCKKEIFGRICQKAAGLGCQAVVDGSHAGDTDSYRPGKRALSELGVISPLAYAGLSKDEIRRLSEQAGLPNWNKPSQSCLATRVPYGDRLSLRLLRRIESAEELLHSLACNQVRVRCHGDLARIEVDCDDFVKIMIPRVRTEIVRAFRELGFSNISLDLAGFRSGSWDEKQNLNLIRETEEAAMVIHE